MNHKRWFNAYIAYKNAKNPEFKEFWLKVMKELQPHVL